MVCVTDILSHSHALNIIFTLPDDRNLHCCDSGWRNECIIPNTMEEYIRLQEEKALSQGETFNWQTATYGKMEYCEDEDDCFTNFESEFPAIVLDDTSREALSWEPTEPSERNHNIGGVFINLEISKCWSLEIPRRLFNTLFSHELNLENHS
ncbi:hypothetical protein Tco_0211861 [Tanacetum coccineum]